MYGKGLKKQLLWDACKKIMTSNKEATFMGTGQETRDFIHISDVLHLTDLLLDRNIKFIIVNGGLGNRITIENILSKVRDIINPKIDINFNNQTDYGNPKFYRANTKKLQSLGFVVKKDMNENLEEYVQWACSLND